MDDAIKSCMKEPTNIYDERLKSQTEKRKFLHHICVYREGLKKKRVRHLGSGCNFDTGLSTSPCLAYNNGVSYLVVTPHKNTSITD